MQWPVVVFTVGPTGIDKQSFNPSKFKDGLPPCWFVLYIGLDVPVCVALYPFLLKSGHVETGSLLDKPEILRES